VTPSDKNIFSEEARIVLIKRGWTVNKLAEKIKRPRESVSKAIRSQRFPLLRKQIAAQLNLQHLITP
jgi:plasmid maintenance system antidote protein VapI